MIRNESFSELNVKIFNYQSYLYKNCLYIHVEYFGHYLLEDEPYVICRVYDFFKLSDFEHLEERINPD